MKGLGTDKLMPEGKKRDVTLDVTQEVNNSPKKDNNSGPAQGHFDSPVISEAGDSDGLKLSEHVDKEKEKKEKEKEEIKKEEMDKHAENDANYKRKVMEEVQTMARKMSREEIEDEKKVDKKHDKTREKPEKAFSPILKAPAKSPDNHKSRSDSRKKKKSKIRDEINGAKRPDSRETITLSQQDEDNSHERQPKGGGGGRARTPGLEARLISRKHDESDELILNMLRENREKEQLRSLIFEVDTFDEVEHPRMRRPHE
ncbi:hypothetical protein PENTCL1PPCAC_9297 [Pristionchus entomophagus]|uniref:Uncharacterized protein n=1 Tax=Pristionchus entomophagus TaxID=358040 RepID=A0AAV5SXN4_9BILA|nr:hypothetical protein PENTCL1PPCAC_9297 [Pristionchus entomophagus]